MQEAARLPMPLAAIDVEFALLAARNVQLEVEPPRLFAHRLNQRRRSRGRRDIPQRLSGQERAQLVENGRRAERELALDEARSRGIQEVLAHRAGAAAQLRKLHRL